ncbi:imidazoleglycerol-phosphate dehydratase HisB [Anaerotignum sp. MB30-C6]|uniref:imidazoleglycerol-phosphate dehydratase HisB n=1 Tax=Anaerotignum sp. MB30-C6 TaxID=3070814 RepID=UPI0027DBCE32|nr:imidazoleglycerol-phosphate dehydratase HisB [Anaerotignum sp. MB30-C6]WMI81875.1 imidazoleglycerol-phosphate dehydratase HisB [Anaerotignum sp. MB30-C6]
MGFSEVKRITGETEIQLSLSLYGTGKSQISTGCGFLDHMLTLFAKHGRFDLTVACKGDTYVDDHHSVEDVGICLGMAFAQALGSCAGIARYGHIILPMDEALILTAVDISGRGHLEFDLQIPTEKVGTFDTELVEEFFIAFTRKSNVTLHMKQIAGKNSHHIIEGVFKAVARSLNMAVAIQDAYRDEIPSTKGVL